MLVSRSCPTSPSVRTRGSLRSRRGVRTATAGFDSISPRNAKNRKNERTDANFRATDARASPEPRIVAR